MFEIADDSSAVFVQLIANGNERSLELPAHDERAVVVGSTAAADFLVSGQRVAPVQFHLERYDGAVWLIPAYGVADLVINGAPAAGPTALEQHNEIKFAGVYLTATVRDAESFAASGAKLVPSEPYAGEFRASYSLNLPGEEDATQLAMTPIVAMSGPDDEWPTNEITPLNVDGQPQRPMATDDGPPVSLPAQTTQRLAPFRQVSDDPAAFTPTGTQIMEPFRPGRAANAPINEEETNAPPHQSVAEHIAYQAPSRAADGFELVPLRNAPRPQTVPPRPTPRKFAEERTAEVTTRADLPPHENVQVRPPVHPSASLHSTSAARRAADETAADIENEPEHVSWLARLGLLTATRPFLVASCASVGAVVLMLAFVAASRLTRHEQVAAAPSSPPTLATTLNALQPAPTAAPLPPEPAETADAQVAAPQIAPERRPQAAAARTGAGHSPEKKSLY